MRNPFDTGAERVADRPMAEPVVLRGSNQSGMRDHNERLVLSLVRQHGALAKSDIARITGLSAQTVSVIMRALEQDGLLLRGEPVRGRIGQPSVPMHLNPEGALFLGLKIGRRSTDLVLVDFLGRVRDTRRRTYRYPTPDAIVAFDCVVTDRKVTNTHTVLFGEVKAVHFGAREPSLIYLDRGYRTL